MKTLRFFTALILSAAVLSCQKSTVSEVPVPQPSTEDVDLVDSNLYSAEDFAALFEGIEVNPQTKCAALSYEITRLTYQSVNGHGEPVTLSMKLAYPEGILTKYHDPKFIVLDNHPTICSQAESPYEKNPIALAKALEDALVVCPDYEGFGVSVGNDHPYLCLDVQARQSTDAVLAAIDYINAKRGIKMKGGYYLENYGYSQGGGVALAVQKYIETGLSAQDQAKLNLRKTACGGGCYSMPLLFDLYFEQDDCVYPAILPLTLLGFKTAYPEIMDGIELSDILREEFLATGIIDRIRSKQYTIDELNEFIESAYGTKLYSQMVVPEYFDKDSAIRQAVDACLAMGYATTGWLPSAKVTLLHSAQDEIVPKELAIHAYDSLKDGNVSEVKWALLSPAHRVTGAFFFMEEMGLNIIPGLIGQLF